MTRGNGETLILGVVVFSSPVFLYLFLPFALLAYFASPRFGRNAVLLLASLIFYAWGEASYVLVMLGMCAFNYLVGLALGDGPRIGRDKVILGIGVSGNLLVLVFFKYWAFIASTIISLFGLAANSPTVHLPLGISFFTFQAISYLVDVYRGDARSQTNAINVALYISLFPQLIAGPIVRYAAISRELGSRRTTFETLTSGIELFAIGLGKKMLLANPIGKVADAVFALPAGSSPMATAWLGCVAYALQIYFDFSGYTDMARGLGRILGFEFPENFRFPYASSSLRDFWRRWHISLSTWFRDYVYIPLGGNRKGSWRASLNLWLVFALCGLWHGASWNFLVWGLMHGSWLMLERSRVGRARERLPSIVGWGITALFVLVAWIPFRSSGLEEAFAYWGTLLSFNSLSVGHPVSVLELLDARFWGSLTIGVALALNAHGKAIAALPKVRWPGVYLFRYIGIVFIAFLSALELAIDQYNPFIYFRF